MSVVDRLSDLQFGLHASTADFSTTPGSFVRIQPTAPPGGLKPRGREKIVRDLISLDGRAFPAVFGARDIGPIDVPLGFKGVSNNTGGATTWQSVMEQATMLDSIFGAVAAASIGAVTTCSGTAGATLTVASGTNIANGSMILFTTTTGSFIREVTSGGGTTTLTLDRAASGTASGNVIRLARWDWDTAITDVIHGGFRAEWNQSLRHDFVGCAPSKWSLDIPDAGKVAFNSTWLPTDSAPGAKLSPTPTPPTSGNPIVNAGGQFSIGAVSFLLSKLKVSGENGMQPRPSFTGPNGVVGYVATDRRPVMFEGEITIGSAPAGIGEIADDSGTPSLRTLLGIATGQTAGTVAGTFDVAIQVGSVAGQCMYMRMPAADIACEVVSSGAYVVAKVKGMACAPSSGAAFRLGVG